MDGDIETSEGSHLTGTTTDKEQGDKSTGSVGEGDSKVIPLTPPITPPSSSLFDRRQRATNISPLCQPVDTDQPTGAVEANSGIGTRPKTRHHSGNPPGVRGITIDGSRDNSPIRGISPYRSPSASPRYPGDKSFNLPAVGASGTRVPSSISDNSIHSGGARPKSAPKRRDNEDHQSSSGRRNTHVGMTMRRRPHRQVLDSESLPEDPQSREVVEQSEEIMQNYMFERYHRDRQNGRAGVPESPTLIENFTRRPQTNTSALGRRLAAIGDEIDAKYQSEFQYMTQSLNISQGAFEEAYDAFKGVAMKLFNSGLTMGRIVALLQFGYHLAIDVLRQGVGDFMSNIVSWLVRFIAVERFTNAITQRTQSIAEWIAGQGGWSRAIEIMNRTILAESAPAIAGYVIACVALVGAVIWFRQR